MMQKLERILRLSALALWLATLAACGSGSSAPATAQRGDVVSSTPVAVISIGISQNIIASLDSIGVDTHSLNVQYGATVSKLVYKTVTPDGRLINASGIVAWSNKGAGGTSPVLMFEHGTIFLDSDAPSNDINTQLTAIVLAAVGYIVVIPDYIGFGASANETHTYVHAAGLAAASVDMLRATRHLLASRAIATNGQLFLTGYSEGGYAALATQREMETRLPAEFTITAALSGAGPYDMTATSRQILELPSNPYPEIAGYVFKSYDRWYRWNRLSNTSMFQSPFNSVVANYYDGQHSSSSVAAALTPTTANLYDNAFLTGFLGAGELAVKTDIAKNNIYNWAPAVPTRLFHGQDDDVVPYNNTTTAYSTMVTDGSTSVTVVDCTTPPSGQRNHANCVPDYLSQVFNWFGTLALNL